MMKTLFFIILLFHGAIAQKSGGKWQTLSGEAPQVVARGGYSGIFPDSSQYAYDLAMSTSLSNVAVFCDVQLTKDGVGLCRSDLRLDNSTNIAVIYPDAKKTYTVNGQPLTGWFAIDFDAQDLMKNVVLIQNVMARPGFFDGFLPISTVEDLRGIKAPKLWINVQHPTFFKQHDLDIEAYITDMGSHTILNYISSPEIGFLKSINGKITRGKPKFIFMCQEPTTLEPSTKKSYGDILKDLSSIKSFASGILVPKTLIWPVSDAMYLETHTTLVPDAHKAGLEVYAYDFANDFPGSYNYSYDPILEYLQFINQPDFSVDGVLSDFPSTASEAIACFAHDQNDKLELKGRPLVITHNGASGYYPGCTDLAYQKAAEDEADIIDCSVQMTKDGLPFCLDSPDLIGQTTAVTSFITRTSNIPEIQKDNGIFSFDLTWSEIQSLKPEIFSPTLEYDIVRNPIAKNQGKFMTLAGFLNFAKDKNVPGVLINIQNAPYLASKKGLDIVDAVTSALTKAGFEKQTTQMVLIQSDDSAVLSAFKKFPNYKRVLLIPEQIGNAPKGTVDGIKAFADIVNLPRGSIVTSTVAFLKSYTKVVQEMHAANITVFVSLLRNEFLTIAMDFYSDPVMEAVTYIKGAGVDGVVTEFPGTSSRYLRSTCYNPPKDATYTLYPVEPGTLLSLAPPYVLPPAQAPPRPLSLADINDPPLPPIRDTDSVNAAAAPEGSNPSGQPPNNVLSFAFFFLSLGLNFIASTHH